MEKQHNVEMCVNGEKVLIDREMSLPEDHTEFNVILLDDKIRKLVWHENPNVSIAYIRQSETTHVFIYVYTGQFGRQCYSRITIKL